jgi:hypothetical protein
MAFPDFKKIFIQSRTEQETIQVTNQAVFTFVQYIGLTVSIAALRKYLNQ